MKNPLTRSEITGLALLVLVIVLVSLGALLPRRCSTPADSLGPEIRLEVIDSAPAPAPTRKERGPKARKKKSTPTKKAAKSAAKTPQRRDPFTDTIKQETGAGARFED